MQYFILLGGCSGCGCGNIAFQRTYEFSANCRRRHSSGLFIGANAVECEEKAEKRQWRGKLSVVFWKNRKFQKTLDKTKKQWYNMWQTRKTDEKEWVVGFHGFREPPVGERRCTGTWWMGFWGRRERNVGIIGRGGPTCSKYCRRRTHCVNKSARILVREKWEDVRTVDVNSGGIAGKPVPYLGQALLFFIGLSEREKKKWKFLISRTSDGVPTPQTSYKQYKFLSARLI